MITSVQLRNFKGHENTKLGLGRFTVFVGDNASGKTSALEGLALLSALNPSPLAPLRGGWEPFDLLRRGSIGPIALVAEGNRGSQRFVTTAEFKLNAEAPPTGNTYDVNLSCQLGATSFKASGRGNAGGGSSSGDWDKIGATLGVATLYRLRADKIAAAAPIENARTSIESDGTNTVVALADMKLADDEAFGRIEEAMRQLIPSMQRVRVHLETGRLTGGKAVSWLTFDFRGAAGVAAHGASHGTLIVLALLAVLHGPHRPNLILLDDFDHALHPRAQMELVRMIQGLLLQEAFQDVQVVATTHSPYTLDLLDPSDIQAFALRDDGTVQTRPLSEHPDAAKMKGALSAGQLWSLDPERTWVLRG